MKLSGGRQSVKTLVRKSFWVPLIMATLAAALLSLEVMDRRAILVELRRRQAELWTGVQSLEDRNAALEAECRRLLTNAGVERVARDSYGFAAPREVTYPFVDAHEKPAPSVALPAACDRWDTWLGKGEYPWRLPAMVFAASILVLGALACLEGTTGNNGARRRQQP